MRVIAGELRGRRLVAPRGARTRPTSDRVREALFSALGEVAGAVVFDLYAGSGALAIEALSRGAARAALVESDRRALEAIRHNVRELELAARVRVIALPLQRAREALAEQGPADLVLADPPYAELQRGAVARALDDLLTDPRCVAPAAQLVLEHAARDAAPALRAARLVRTRRYGDTSLTFYLCTRADEPVH